MLSNFEAKITEEQMNEYNYRNDLLDDSICIFCLKRCASRGYSNRYEAIQGYYKDNEEHEIVLYACDICTHVDNDRLFLPKTKIKMPDGKEFIIDSINREND